MKMTLDAFRTAIGSNLMPMFNRRRFLTIAAAAAGAGALAGTAVRSAPLYRWEGVALGSGASITLSHPDAAHIVGRAVAEISRLEGIFSLYRKDSALVRLNETGHLPHPPFELLECLTLCNTVHSATGGMFDPSIQPLWQLYAENHRAGKAPSSEQIAASLQNVGWAGVRVGGSGVSLARKGMALTLNGVAQGFIADRVVALLAAEGLSDILVDTGEFRALGGHPTRRAGWPISLDVDGEILPDALSLRDKALASSAPLGTVFDAAATVGHILNPKSGQASTAAWRLVSVTAPSAGLADALSSAFCLMNRAEIDTALAIFPEARLAYLA